MKDLIVAGAGPAGLATALYAAGHGLDTVVLEARLDPSQAMGPAGSLDAAHSIDPAHSIDKACGEGLMPGAVRALSELGVRPDGQPLRGIRYLDSRRSVDAPFRSGPGLGVRRTVLHQALLDAVKAAGVEVIGQRVRDVRSEAGHVNVDGERARYLAVADGLHSPIRRQLGLERPRTRNVPRWGIRQHFAVAPWTDMVEVHWARSAEAYVTPVGAELVGVAVLSGQRGSFADQLANFPHLQERLAGYAATDVRGAGPLRQRTSARVAGRVLLVGDAAGYVDALTGEGIAVALACARALVECVSVDDPQAYERRWLAASRRYRAITSTLLWARGQPRLAPHIVTLAARLPRVFQAAVRQLAH